MSVCDRKHMYIHILHVCICMWGGICMCVRVWGCVWGMGCGGVCECICVYVGMHVYAYGGWGYVCMWVFTCVHVWGLWGCVRCVGCGGMCVSVYVCMWVSKCMHVWWGVVM